MKKHFFISFLIIILALPTIIRCSKEDPAPPTFEELLTGGASDTDGKSWVLSKGTFPSDDGGGAVSNGLQTLIPIPADIQTILGDIYDTKFTFFSSGKYTISPVGGKVLGATLYSTLNGLTIDGTQNALGLCHANFAGVTDGTWALHEDDFTVNAILNPLDNTTPPGQGSVLFTGKKWLSFSTGAYFPILDGNATSHVMIKEVTETTMHVAFMVGMYQGVMNPGGLAFAAVPTHIFQLTLEAQ
jgi:hypothetical protein